jgi:hypothetical protein
MAEADNTDPLAEQIARSFQANVTGAGAASVG